MNINYQWYPGHMTKAIRMMRENLKLIDLVVEIVDARAPYSSKNPDLDELAQNKFRLILLNKADLADPAETKKWDVYYESKGLGVLKTNAKNKDGIKEVLRLIPEICKEKLERDKRKGIINRPIRAMVCGVPNVGKSSFINSVTKKVSAKTGNKPGVTKGKQWITVNQSLELLDTPGVLWPKFEDENTGLNLAILGCMNDDILPIQELGMELLFFLCKKYPDALQGRYGIRKTDISLTQEVFPLLEQIAIGRKCLKKGNSPDCDKMAALLMEDFRSGRLGRISLESP